MAQSWKSPRNGVYYCRITIPKDVRELLGGKWEWKKSLGTKDLSTARLRFRAESLRYEEALYAAREQLKGTLQVLPSDAPRLADRWADKQIKALSEQPELIEGFLAEAGKELLPLDVFAAQRLIEEGSMDDANRQEKAGHESDLSGLEYLEIPMISYVRRENLKQSSRIIAWCRNWLRKLLS